MLDDSLLDDQARLADLDRVSGGCLRAAASAGAQVRSTTELADEAGVPRLAGARPRALVLVTRPGVGPAVVRLLVALLTTECPVPVVVAPAVPVWAGALDVVVAHTDDPDDIVLAESVDRARRRGASIVVTAPPDGPVAAAAAGTFLLPPRVRVAGEFSYPRALAAGLIVLDTLGLLRTDLRSLADELDREAERDGTVFESFVNPAKSIALRVADRVPLLCGLDEPATAVAEHASEALARFAGVVAAVGGYPQVFSRTVLHRAAVRATSGEDMFADPEDHVGGPRVLLLSVERDQVAEAINRRAQAVLPGADVVSAGEETTGTAAVHAAVLAQRLEMAAIYLGLATGALGGTGRDAPLVG